MLLRATDRSGWVPSDHPHSSGPLLGLTPPPLLRRALLQRLRFDRCCTQVRPQQQIRRSALRPQKIKSERSAEHSALHYSGAALASERSWQGGCAWL